MTFEDLSKQLNTSVQNLPSLVQVLSAAFSDIEGGGGGSSYEYSTEEKVVGKWIDGKPLYRITKNVAFNELTHQGSLYYTPTVENGQTLRNINALAYGSIYGECALGCNAYGDNTMNASIELNMYYTNVALQFNNTTQEVAAVGGITITYEYTKSTD